MRFFGLIKKSLIVASILLIAFSCSQRPARIVNNYDEFYSKNNSLKKQKNKRSSITKIKKSSGLEIAVRPGDNLYNIAQQYHTTIYEIIKKNNLSPPYILHVGQNIKIPLPNYHTVVHGDSLYSISRDYNMNMDKLIRLNKLKKPYSIFTGQKLRIANTSASVNRSRRKSQRRSKSSKNFITKRLKSSNKFIWPTKGKVISTFGAKKGGLYNDGINIKAKKGNSVKAAESGVVAYVGNELKGYGNLIIIKHSSGWITAYAHLGSLSVKRGQEVSKGQEIATIGSSGNVDSSQLYFGLRKGRDALDPIKYLK